MKAFISTVIISQIILLTVLNAFLSLSTTELSIVKENEMRITVYHMKRLADQIYSAWLILNQSNANLDTFEKYRQAILSHAREISPLELKVFIFNKTTLNLEIRASSLNLSKEVII